MRTFKETVKQIRDAEKDVDKVLDAAKLSRNPINGNERLEMILNTILAIVGIVAGSLCFIAFIWLMLR